jgi:DNA-directed RNA polymerase sigma subunit (sigma70/sigma32)
MGELRPTTSREESDEYQELLEQVPETHSPDPYRLPKPTKTGKGGMLETALQGERVEYFLPGLSTREQVILMMKYGLGGYQLRTYEDIAREFYLTRETIRLSHNSALGKIRLSIEENQRLGSTRDESN